MCGIMGYVGDKEAVSVLLDGLKRLEYRGYDSAGVAVFKDGRILVSKEKGSPENLEELIKKDAVFSGKAGLGHTRWATHGAPSRANSHPHLSFSGSFAVVHNGIIENYASLRDRLTELGFCFDSQTDTEVISNLLEYYYQQEKNVLSAIACVLNQLQGAYALGIMFDGECDRLYVAKKDSPLVAAMGGNESFIASDISALLPYSRNMFILNDGELGIIGADYAQFFKLEDKKTIPIKKQLTHIDWDISAAEKGGYEHFMLKEIYETPRAVRSCIAPRIKDGKISLECALSKQELDQIDKIICIGCGSAYHVAVTAKYVFEELVKLPFEAVIASEFRYAQPVLDERTLVLVISQSGETADTLAALKMANERGVKLISIVNVLGSTMANLSSRVLFTWAGPEIAVATTKAYSAQLAAIYLLAISMGEERGAISQQKAHELTKGLIELPELIEKTLKSADRVKNIAKYANAQQGAFFIGRNIDYSTALEAALKLKEISYVSADCYAAGEIKHGPISLICKDSLVIAVCGVDRLNEKLLANILEVKARGARVLAVVTEGEQKICKEAQFVLTTPPVPDIFTASITIIPLQLFSYYVAKDLNKSIDKPRNLAKSVTVE